MQNSNRSFGANLFFLGYKVHKIRQKNTYPEPLIVNGISMFKSRGFPFDRCESRSWTLFTFTSFMCNAGKVGHLNTHADSQLVVLHMYFTISTLY